MPEFEACVQVLPCVGDWAVLYLSQFFLLWNEDHSHTLQVFDSMHDLHLALCLELRKVSGLTTLGFISPNIVSFLPAEEGPHVKERNIWLEFIYGAFVNVNK